MKVGRKSRRHLKVLVALIVTIIMGISLSAAAFAGTGDSRKPVRVGYFTMENFMEGGVDGTPKSGYTYELLCEIASYNHWDIEYVYGDFSDLYQQLADGKIDILPNIIATEERQKQVLFHSMSLNEEHYFISTLTDNIDIEKATTAYLCFTLI